VVVIKEGIDFLVGKKEGGLSFIYIPEGREELWR
jgi:valyl-tRNA synthetase